METTYDSIAELTAARVDESQMMMDPGVVVAIITQVLPIIAGCFSRKYSPDPAYAAETFREMYATDPHKLRKKLASRIRSQADQPMSKSQSFILAEAIIQQMLDTPDSVITAGCNEAPSDI